MTEFRKVVERIRKLADGRRHYDGTDDYTCFDALGDVRQICDEALGGCDMSEWEPESGRVTVTEENFGDVRGWLQRRIDAATTFDGERLEVSNFFVNGNECSDIEDCKVGDLVEDPVAWMGRMHARQLKHRSF